MRSGIKMEKMEEMVVEINEIYNFIKVWAIVCVSLCYCYIVARFLIPTRMVMTRLLAFLPVFSLFIYLPLKLSSVHLIAFTSFSIAWLANFKLLLFAFGKGSLVFNFNTSFDDHHHHHHHLIFISLSRFLILASLPITVVLLQPKNPSPNPNHHHHKLTTQYFKSNNNANYYSIFIINYFPKCLILGLFLKVYEHIHQEAILVFYSYVIMTYILLDLMLTLSASLTRFFLGIHLAPQFDKPYLSTSLHEFWGRRWNNVAHSVLRPAVYEPLLAVFTLAIGRKWASLPAIFGTFLVSGLIHEVIYYYLALGRVKPTWEITCLFLIHGFSMMCEIGVKKVYKGLSSSSSSWRLIEQIQVPRVVLISLTMGYLMVTGYWLFFTQLIRSKVDVRASREYAAVGAFVNSILFK